MDILSPSYWSPGINIILNYGFLLITLMLTLMVQLTDTDIHWDNIVVPDDLVLHVT